MAIAVPGLLVLLLVPGLLVGAPLHEVPDAEILIDLPPLGSARNHEVGALARHRLALSLSEWNAAEAALEDDSFPAPLRAWLRGRMLLIRQRPAAASLELEAAARAFAADFSDHVEPRPVLMALDRDRLGAALATADVERARTVVDTPVTDHGDDPRWRALRGALLVAEGNVTAARATLDRAWADASRRERATFAFSHRATLRLADGETEAAADAWLDFVGVLRRPGELRAAVQVWDQHEALRRAVSTDGRRERAVRWLARVIRREDALAIARDGVERATGEEAATCFVLAAEQLYRLRRHTELMGHLEQTWPAALDAEQRAALEAYPWGVRRRQGQTLSPARGFDDVVMRNRGTARAVEALWESAWMWELGGEPAVASERFRQYAEDHPSGPFGAAAAARAVFLPFQQGELAAALEAYDDLTVALGTSMDQACAMWLRARAIAATGGDASVAMRELSDEHPHNPLQFPPPFPLEAATEVRGAARDTLLEELAQTQREAVQTIARHLEVDPFAGSDPRLDLAQRFLELGLFAEGEALLAEIAAVDRRDPARQLQATAVAWRYGRAERQARSGYQLRLLLRGTDPALDRALDVLAHPVPFAREVLTAARKRRLPAGLLWSLMRRESFYEADVTSIAGAHGLMQLMPATARRMATALGDGDPQVADLHRPLVNLKYGTHYLRQLLGEAEGDVYRALAAYNAGETNGQRWAERRSPDSPPQEMILLISYSETRGYVYNILRTWRLISAAYPSLARADGLQP